MMWPFVGVVMVTVCVTACARSLRRRHCTDASFWGGLAVVNVALLIVELVTP